MKNNVLKLNDAIVFLKDIIDPYIGAVTLSQNKIVIQIENKTLFIPIGLIKVMLFKRNANSFGFVFNSKLYKDKKDFNYWNKETNKIAQRELESCNIYGD
ncbi:hypothetical protein R0Q57_08270 [Lactobacillus acidophilus]